MSHPKWRVTDTVGHNVVRALAASVRVREIFFIIVIWSRNSWIWVLVDCRWVLLFDDGNRIWFEVQVIAYVSYPKWRVTDIVGHNVVRGLVTSVRVREYWAFLSHEYIHAIGYTTPRIFLAWPNDKHMGRNSSSARIGIDALYWYAEWIIAMADGEDVQPLVCDNGSGMVKVCFRNGQFSLRFVMSNNWLLHYWSSKPSVQVIAMTLSTMPVYLLWYHGLHNVGN